MATKETSNKAAVAAENESNKAAVAAENESNKTNTKAEEIAQLQQNAADSLNALWDALRKKGYRVFNVIQLFGIAFDIKKNEEGEQQSLKAHDLTGISAEEQRRENREESPFIAQPARQEQEFRNVMNNGGRTRSINTKANNHNGKVL